MPEGLARVGPTPSTVSDPLTTALVVDVESRSLLELPKVGTHRYAAHPSTRLLVACFGFVNGNADPEVWLPGTPLPDAVHAHLMTGGMLAAWNAAFDVAILNRFLPQEIPRITIAQTHDIAAQAASASLPRGLDKCCAAIGLLEAKDRAGQAAMRGFMRPRKWVDGQPMWGQDPKRFALLVAYCQQDVRLERAIMRRLPRLQAIDRPVFELDARINARGMMIDRTLITIGGPALYRAMLEANRRIAELTRNEATPVPKVTVTLPSGRRLRYPQPHIVEEVNRFGNLVDVLKAFGVSQYTHQWGAESKHGSLLFQNCVQAIARDLLVAAAQRFEAAALPVILHVHDELLAEAPIERGVTHALVHALMTQRPTWTAGLPIDAEVWVGARYGKPVKLPRKDIAELEEANR
jgi:hypothetical protein